MYTLVCFPDWIELWKAEAVYVIHLRILHALANTIRHCMKYVVVEYNSGVLKNKEGILAFT